MGENQIPKYPLKTLVKFKYGHDDYIGQIIKSDIVKEGHLGRIPGTILYMIRILSINRQKIADNRITTIGEDEILEAKKPQ